MAGNILEQIRKPKKTALIATAAVATVVWQSRACLDIQQSTPTIPAITQPSLYQENYLKIPSKPSKKGTGAKSEIQKQWAQIDKQKGPR